MGLEVIYIVRHGYRTNWVVDPSTGRYSTTIRTPTGIPSDPALASYGVRQASQLATHLLGLEPKVDLIYSSPYYRCLQTLDPYITQLASRPQSSKAAKVHLDPGIGEFYGRAHFDHPQAASLEVLQEHFENLTTSSAGPTIVPSIKGESISQLHDRVAYSLATLIARADADPSQPKTLLICSHAASMICAGRVLTGNMPADVGAEDFRVFTCGLSTFVRRSTVASVSEGEKWSPDRPEEIPELTWKDGNGVGGGWDCVANGDCSFLDGGEERGWRFSGDESFLNDPNAFNDASNNEGGVTRLIGAADDIGEKSRL